jgi:hypothetical protein
VTARDDMTEAVGPVYMAGPITAQPGRSVVVNVLTAARTLRYLTERRVAAVCPQLATADVLVAPINAEIAAVPYEDWMSVDFLLLASCRAVLVLPGWEGSAGTRREIAYAGDRGIPVFFAIRPLLKFLGVEARAAAPVKGAKG